MISLNRLDPSINVANIAILSAQDVYAIDKKYDDGIAATGEIMGFNVAGNPGTCVTKDYTDYASGVGVYVNTSSTIACKIFFMVDTQSQ